jgi:hypothetical protein
LSGAVAVPDVVSVLTAPATDALRGVVPISKTVGLTTPATDALNGAAPLPGVAPGKTGGVLDVLPSVSSALPLPSTATIGDAIAPSSGVLSSVPPAAVSTGAPADALGSPPDSSLVSATPPTGAGSPLGFDNVVPIDPATIAHALASPETRLVIVGLLGAYAAGRASGLGMLDFAQPVLRSCTASVRLAFSPVRLVPCPRHAWSSGGKTLVSRADAPGAMAELRQRGGNMDDSRTWFKPPVVAAGTFPARLWSVPRNDNVVLRVLAAVLAALTAAIAGVGGRRLMRGPVATTNGSGRTP